MTDTIVKELVSGIEPARRSPGGESYFSLEDTLELLRRCGRMGIAAVYPEVFEQLGKSVKVVDMHGFDNHLKENASWGEIVAKVNAHALAFVEQQRKRPAPVLFTWVVFSSPEDGESL